jgi:hypothetical protein
MGDFLEYYKSIPAYKNDTTSYNLRRAFELAPKEELDAFAKSDAHLNSVYLNKQTGIYEFMKSKDHPTLKYELDWFNSSDPEAIQFRKDYSLDTTGTYYKYIPKKQEGGYVRTSKSGRKFTYPSFEGQKQEIINRILTK